MSYLAQLYTNTLSNQNISSALLVGTFTNTTRIRKVTISVSLDQIAGGGDYVVYATRQRAGAGSAYRKVPITTATVASGVTAIDLDSIAITLNATDVLKVYVTGLAGDTTTPDIIVDVNEEFINVDSSGNPTALDAAGVRTAVGLATANLDTQLAEIEGETDDIAAIKTKTDQLTFTVANEVDANMQGGGTSTFIYTVTVGGNPVSGALVEVSTDSAGSNRIRQGTTDSLGVVTFRLNPGVYYFWTSRSGDTFTNPTVQTVV